MSVAHMVYALIIIGCVTSIFWTLLRTRSWWLYEQLQNRHGSYQLKLIDGRFKIQALRHRIIHKLGDPNSSFKSSFSLKLVGVKWDIQPWYGRIMPRKEWRIGMSYKGTSILLEHKELAKLVNDRFEEMKLVHGWTKNTALELDRSLR